MTQEEKNKALFAAVGQGDLEKVKELLASGAQVDVKDIWDRQPLHWAARGGHLPVVKYLIEEQGTQVDVKDMYGQQPLHLAACDCRLPVVKYLVEERGAEVDAKDNGDWQPLHTAVIYGHLPVVKYLIREQGVQVDAKDRDGKTPTELARDSPEIRKFLEEWASPENMEKRRQMANVKAVRAHWKRLGGLLPKPGPGM